MVGGYQYDIHPKPEYNGMLYHERGRGIVAQHGQKVMVDEAGDKWVTGTAGPIQQIELEEWNTYEIIATGNKLVHKLKRKILTYLSSKETILNRSLSNCFHIADYVSLLRLTPFGLCD